MLLLKISTIMLSLLTQLPILMSNSLAGICLNALYTPLQKGIGH